MLSFIDKILHLLNFPPTLFMWRIWQQGHTHFKVRVKGYIHEWPMNKLGSTSSTLPQVNLSIASPPTMHLCHARLGHPQPHITKDSVSSFNLWDTNNECFTFCYSYLCNKSHRLPFGDNSISSSRSFEVVYSDVQVPFPILSFDNFKFYIISVDHFSKYTWVFPLKAKSDVKDIYLQNLCRMIHNYCWCTLHRWWGRIHWTKIISH